MPTYEYACDSCSHRWELFQSIKAAPEKKCPSCGRKKARRLISGGGGLLFKGSGFYITDYRSEAYKSAAKEESGSAASPSSSKPAESGSPAADKPAAAANAAPASTAPSQPAAPSKGSSDGADRSS